MSTQKRMTKNKIDKVRHHKLYFKKVYLLLCLAIGIGTPCFSQEFKIPKPMEIEKSSDKINHKKLTESAILEAPKEVYQYVYKSISKKETKKLNIKDAIYVVDILVKDSLIVECEVLNFFYSSDGEYLVKKPGNNELLQNVFLNKRVKFKFIEEFSDFYSFRLMGEEF